MGMPVQVLAVLARPCRTQKISEAVKAVVRSLPPSVILRRWMASAVEEEAGARRLADQIPARKTGGIFIEYPAPTEGGGVSINPKARETAMSSKFEEVVTIKAPRGTRAALQELAVRKYIAVILQGRRSDAYNLPGVHAVPGFCRPRGGLWHKH